MRKSKVVAELSDEKWLCDFQCCDISHLLHDSTMELQFEQKFISDTFGAMGDL
jgi:hypothetical protein